MVADAPGDMPVTMPEREPTAAPAELAHNPPPTRSPREMVVPWHTVDGPVIAVGERLTVTVLLVVQPVGRV